MTVSELIKELEKLPDHHMDAEIRTGPIEGGWIFVEETRLMSGSGILLLTTPDSKDEY